MKCFNLINLLGNVKLRMLKNGKGSIYRRHCNENINLSVLVTFGQIMKKISQKISDKHAHSRGVSAVELIIVLVLIGLLAAFAIPQLLGARRLFRFTGIEQQLSVTLRDARQLAMTERRRVTVQYDDSAKRLIVYEEPIVPAPTPAPIDTLGPLGDSRNRIVTFTDNGLFAGDIIYGVPPLTPVPSTTLPDTAAITPLSPGVGGIVKVTFNPRGDVAIPTTGVIDTNKALFFYERNSNTTFAVSILAPGGRVKIWRYNGASYE